jgi:hypothetical protein
LELPRELRGATRSYEELLLTTRSHWGDALIVREPLLTTRSHGAGDALTVREPP